MREICLDTETTGISPHGDDRIIEIACVELFNTVPTGKEWHSYVNPLRDVPPEAVAIHGLKEEFLRDKPLFSDIADDFLAFIGDSPIVAHNAPFDIAFLNSEMEKAGRAPLSNPVVDTLREAKKRLGATARASLDSLCKRYGVDLSERVKHEALIDTRLLAKVYQHLLGGINRSLELSGENMHVAAKGCFYPDRGTGAAQENEIALHENFVNTVMRGYSKAVLWDACG